MKPVKLQREIEISNFQGLYVVKFTSEGTALKLVQQGDENILDFSQRIGLIILSTTF